MAATPHICHVFSSFDAGGVEVRTVNIINALGREYRHTILATDGRYGASSRLGSDIDATILPPPKGKGGVLYGLAFSAVLRSLKPTLLATYNWGAIDAVIGGRLASVCPIVHGEDGFGPDEAQGLKRRRVLTRRVILRSVFATVVPSKTLLNVALHRYHLPPSKVRLIRNGVDLSRFRSRNERPWRSAHAVPDDALLVGFVGALRPEKRLEHLLSAVDRARESNIWLAIVGDGPCRVALQDLARTLSIRDRVVFAGSEPDPALAYSSFDIFAMSSITEQMPVSLLEAMATGLPAICTDVGDTRDILGEGATSCVVPFDDLAAFTDALLRLTRDPGLRRKLGTMNRARCEEEFSHDRMLGEYRVLYKSAAEAWTPRTNVSP